MQEPDANFRERAGPSTSGEGGSGPLPPRWLELLAKLNTEVGPWVMPEDHTVATADIPPIEHDGPPVGSDRVLAARWRPKQV
jgi:hypothetical protein